MQAADVLPGSGAGFLTRRGRWHLKRFLRWSAVLTLVLCLVARVALALDITTTDGRTYKGVTISAVEPDALRIMHSDGAARIAYEKLPAALQKQYFDPEKVAAYHEEVAAAKRAAEAAAAAKVEAERRQKAIAAAQAEERREQEAEAHQREKAVQQEKEAAEKTASQAAESLRQTIEHREAGFFFGAVALGILVGIFVYFLPTIIGRHKANAMAIFMLNLFLGWTFLGWVIALVWACTQDSALEQLARARMTMPPQPEPSPRPYGAVGGPQIENGRQVEGGRQLEGGNGRYLE